MSRFTFKKSADNSQPTLTIQEGIYAAVVVQAAHIGLQRPFDRDKDPEEQLAVAFELASGELITKRMKFSNHPSSICYALFTAAFPDLDESSDQELGSADLLGKSVLIEVAVHDSKWPRITAIMPLEEGFKPVERKTELLEFDADEMDREIYVKLHRDLRNWVSKRIRHSL